ncbi:MAG: ABC transporter permease, partial [Spirochaetota bacterium]
QGSGGKAPGGEGAESGGVVFMPGEKLQDIQPPASGDIGVEPMFDQNQYPFEELEDLEKPLLENFMGMRVTPDYFAMYELSVAEGSLFTEEDIVQGNPVLVLGHELAKRLFTDGTALNRRIRLNGIVYTVIGILVPERYRESENDSMAFAPYPVPGLRFPKGKKGGVAYGFGSQSLVLTFGVKATAHLKQAVGQLTAYFTRQYGEDNFTITPRWDQAKENQKKHNRLFVVIGFLAGSALLISSITIFNLMTIRMIRRAKSIGIFRSFGATRMDIFAVFLGESLILGFLGGILGFLLAPLLYRVLLNYLIPASWSISLTTGINWPVMSLSLIGAMCINLVFGVFPAFRASRTSVVESIRAE